MSEWFAVSPETMPKAGDYVLAVIPDDYDLQWVVRAMWLSPELASDLDWETEDGDPSEPGWYEVAWSEDEKMWPIDPTHWRALPAPPVPV